ncbi:reverse transcriptase domain-containing protein [Tanacetum coccineum]
MMGVLRHVAEHRLNVREGCQRIRQKKRGQAAERNIAINEEVSKLVTAGIMREVHYHDWLSNPMMATNNEAEYEALIAGLRIAEKIGVQNLQVNVDSKLVANQVNGTYIAKETEMVKYLEKVKTLAKAFWQFSINQVPRMENKQAMKLSKKHQPPAFAQSSKQDPHKRTTSFGKYTKAHVAMHAAHRSVVTKAQVPVNTGQTMHKGTQGAYQSHVQVNAKCTNPSQEIRKKD